MERAVRNWSCCLVAFALLGGGCTRASRDTGSTPVPVTPVERGAGTYREYCQSCHGPEARGDGPLAALLKVPPPDLTRLAARHGGTYPVDLVYGTIDGREAVSGHGSREMPVWGNVWTDQEGGPDAEERMRTQINELVEYLRTLQRP